MSAGCTLKVFSVKIALGYIVCFKITTCNDHIGQISCYKKVMKLQKFYSALTNRMVTGESKLKPDLFLTNTGTT